ncbi:MAG TPA: amidase [Candidatus Binataceae bacterium]|nr:amidase [Candidatus Binataceae bacterium]
MLNPFSEAWQIRELIAKKEVSLREIAEFFNRRIESLNPRLGAYMTPTPERALADAVRLEKASADEIAKMPLYGIPYSLKDLTWTAGIKTTMGSKNFENFVPPADAEVAIRIRDAGGILLGKTTTPELGGRPTTEGGLCPPARNPWNLEHTAGGSSGGAACAAAAGLGPLAEGSDGGGSIRIPSSCCGTVGLKPSRGRVSFAPLIGEAWAGFATSGPIARSVRDVALFLDVLAGPVVGDPYWAPPPSESFSAALNRRPEKLRLAAILKSAEGKVDPEVEAATESALKTFTEMGHSVEYIDLDPAAMLIGPSGVIITAGVGSIPIPDPKLMDPVIRATWERGKDYKAAEYINAIMQMHNISRIIMQTLAPYDALITPTLTRPAVRLGSLPSDIRGGFREVFEWLAFTFPFNATGQPACSLPNGFSSDGLPIGLQIVGRQNDEAGIIALAAQFEEARPWIDQLPPLD